MDEVFSKLGRWPCHAALLTVICPTPPQNRQTNFPRRYLLSEAARFGGKLLPQPVSSDYCEPFSGLMILSRI